MPIRWPNVSRPECEISHQCESGDSLRDEGMALAALKHSVDIRQGRIRLLLAMLGRKDRTGTLDDIAPDLHTKYPDGGHWVGSVPVELVRRSIVKPIAFVRSARKSRHGGPTRLYRIINEEAARQFIEELTRLEESEQCSANCA